MQLTMDRISPCILHRELRKKRRHSSIPVLLIKNVENTTRKLNVKHTTRNALRMINGQLYAAIILKVTRNTTYRSTALQVSGWKRFPN